MISMFGRLILISVCIFFIIAFFDPETKDSNELYNKINQRAQSSDMKSAFAGEEFWEDIDQQLCDDPEFDETWKKPESLCYSVVRGYEETRIEVLSSSPPLVIYRRFFTKKQIDDYSRIFKKRNLGKQTVVSPNGTDHSSTIRVANGLATPVSDFPEAQSLHDTASRLIPAINFDNSEPIQDITALTTTTLMSVVYRKMTIEWQRFLISIKAANVGGGTVFPYLGTVARTKPGDAILWFNMKQNRELEPLSLHGGCPVRSGEKIVAAISVERKGQELFKTFDEDKSFCADVLLH
ncbi:hypothetical protein CAEBREN_03684 [Caenorhabditis brenneri]|uniref:Prolyl 4-hydroxylase alpha subunit domain-containing protein n=1 Tax=Caenorhabditis brenneri TaxID=135651 RepID=G0MWC4_CAEBE|nr:hypothetical protein CAEBREN_03684 [Caenorhabditis brenneri]